MSYLWICKGLELFESGGDMTSYENINPHPEIYRSIIDDHVYHAIDQKTFLSQL
jgi:hypothetical protein